MIAKFGDNGVVRDAYVLSSVIITASSVAAAAVALVSGMMARGVSDVG
ncbi:hypothetical protein [Streptosporangium sp. NPDC087985]